MKVIIVGAGITGLIAGVYAQQSGLDVTIYESHASAGGNCCSWDRKGFHFEGGMHWLVGSNSESKFYKHWCEVGALKSNNPIIFRDEFLTLFDGDQTIKIQDIEQFRTHLLAVSPQDKKPINKLIKNIKSMMGLDMPIMDIKGVKVKNKSSMGFRDMLPYIKAGSTILKATKISVAEYISAFKHEGIKTLLSSIVYRTDFSAMSMLFTIAGYTGKDCGQPVGGSKVFSQNILDTFIELGGKIEFNKMVEKVELSNKKATGVWINKKLIKADAVIVASDTRVAIDQLFDNKLNEDWMPIMREEIKPISCTFLSLGVNANLSHLPANFIFPLKTSFVFDKEKIKYLGINNYANYPGYAPKNATALTSAITTDSYDYWKRAKDDGTYAAKKQALADELIKNIVELLPELKDKIVLWDIATPLTYERYCHTYQGGWMSAMLPNVKQKSTCPKAKTVNNLYFAGQRLMMPGGLPTCLTTARTAVQHLCKDANITFQQNLKLSK